MTVPGLTFLRESDTPSARILARSGSADIGAIFPPWGGGAKWRWRMWVAVAYVGSKEGEAPSELAARNALLAAWADFVRALGLQSIEDNTP